MYLKTHLDGSKTKPDSSIKSHSSTLLMQPSDGRHKNKNTHTLEKLLLRKNLVNFSVMFSDVVVFLCSRNHYCRLMERIVCSSKNVDVHIATAKEITTSN